MNLESNKMRRIRTSRADRVGLVAFAALAALLGGALPARAVTLRYQANQTGDFILIGNTLGHDCGSGTPTPVVGTVGDCSHSTSDEAPDVFWRSTDPTGATADTTITASTARSTAILSVPAGASVTYARLYWSASGTTTAADTSVLVEGVGSGAFSSTVTADASFTASTTGADAHDYYQATADVTALVQAHGSGNYRISGVDALALADVNSGTIYAAWSMVVFYRSSSAPPRNLTIFDGLNLIDSHSAPVTVTVSGFQVPNSGYDAKVACIAYLGDVRGNGDSLSWNGTAVSDALNPATNFFNSTHSYLGTAVSNVGDLPQLDGTSSSMSGIDLDVIDVTAKVTKGDTSATVTAATSLDFYILGAFVTSIATTKPDLSGTTKTVADLNSHTGGAVLTGDTLEYTIATSNSGFDTAVGVVLNDVLPTGLTLVPGSIRVASGANTGTKTDASGDDQGEYISGSRTVRVWLGTGATAAAGGTLAAGASTSVVFRVTVDASALGTIQNQAVITASGQTGSAAQDYTSSASVLVEKCVQNSDCGGGTPYCLTSVSPRSCVSCLSSSNCGGTTPFCNTATHACRACAADADCSAGAPACQSSGACGACSASNIGLCGGATPICNTANATCVQCLLGSQCSGATPICNTTTKVCVGCLANADCGGTTPVCDPLLLSCRACGGDGECGGATPACQAGGACGQCSATNGIQCSGATPVCYTATGTCVPCTSNAQCGGTTPVCNGRRTPAAPARATASAAAPRPPARPAAPAASAPRRTPPSAAAPRRSATSRRGRAFRARRTPSAAARRPSATSRRTSAAPAPATASAAAPRPRASPVALAASAPRRAAPSAAAPRRSVTQRAAPAFPVPRTPSVAARRPSATARRTPAAPAPATVNAAGPRPRASPAVLAASAPPATPAAAAAPRHFVTPRAESA